MTRVSSLLLAALLAFAGCASTGLAGEGPDAVLEGVEVSVITAHEAVPGRGPLGISDRFTLEGRMVAFVTMRWPENHAAWGTRRFESRWYHLDAQGEHLVKKIETPFSIARSPYFITSPLFPAALGLGPGRYELFANGRKLAEHSFEIVEAAQGPAMPARRSVPSTGT